MLNQNRETLAAILTDQTKRKSDRHRARHCLRREYPSGARTPFVEVIGNSDEDTQLRFCLIRELPRLDAEVSPEGARVLSTLAASSREPAILRSEARRTLETIDAPAPESGGMSEGLTEESADETEFNGGIAAVTEFVLNALYLGRDRFGGEETPLFVDGIHVDTLEPARWTYDGSEWIVSNFASQQNFMRTLVGLSRITGDGTYKKAAEETITYLFEEYQQGDGLLPWGGHRFIDLETGSAIYEFDNGYHELKAVFPFYELLFDVDSESAARLVEGMWESHMRDWSEQFYHSRHGERLDELPADVWDRPFDRPEPHQRIPRVGAMNHTSHDLMYAAVSAFVHANDEGALKWAKRKGDMWYRARNSETDLGSYYYHLEPTHYPGTDDHRGYEWPRFEEYGEAATSTRLWYSPNVPETVYTKSALAKLRMAALLGESEGEEFRAWGHSALRAFAASNAYNPEKNTINLLLTDGRVVERDVAEASSRYFYAFSLGYRHTEDTELWPIVRGVARGHGLGDVGTQPGHQVALNLETESAEPRLLLGLLELYRIDESDEYLRLAKRIGSNILETKFHDGFFVSSADHIYSKFDALEPLALLALNAVSRGESELVPTYVAENSIHGTFDGYGRTRDSTAIWSKQR